MVTVGLKEHVQTAMSGRRGEEGEGWKGKGEVREKILIN